MLFNNTRILRQIFTLCFEAALTAGLEGYTAVVILSVDRMVLITRQRVLKLLKAWKHYGIFLN